MPTVADDPRWAVIFERRSTGESWPQEAEDQLQALAQAGEVPPQFLPQLKSSPLRSATPTVPSPLLSFDAWRKQAIPPTLMGPRMLDPRTTMQTTPGLPPSQPVPSSILQASPVVTLGAWQDVPPGPPPVASPFLPAQRWVGPPLPPAVPQIRQQPVEMLQPPIPPIEPPVTWVTGTPPAMTPQIVGPYVPIAPAGQPSGPTMMPTASGEAVPVKEAGPWLDISLGAQNATHWITNTLANTVGLSNTLGTIVNRHLFGGRLPEGALAPAMEAALRDAAEQVKANPALLQERDTFAQLLLQSATAFTMQLPVYAGVVATTGLPGFIGLGALSEADKGALSAGIGAAKNAVFYGVLQGVRALPLPIEQLPSWIQPLARTVVGSAGFATGGTTTRAVEQLLTGQPLSVDTRQAMIDALLGGGLSLWAGGPRQITLPSGGTLESAAPTMLRDALGFYRAGRTPENVASHLSTAYGLHPDVAQRVAVNAHGIYQDWLAGRSSQPTAQETPTGAPSAPPPPTPPIGLLTRDTLGETRPPMPSPPVVPSPVPPSQPSSAPSLASLPEGVTEAVIAQQLQMFPGTTREEAIAAFQQAQPGTPSPAPSAPFAPPPTPTETPGIGRIKVDIAKPTPPDTEAPTSLADLDGELVRLATDLGMATTPEAQQALLDAAHQVYAQAQQQGTDPEQVVRQWFGAQVEQASAAPEAPPSAMSEIDIRTGESSRLFAQSMWPDATYEARRGWLGEGADIGRSWDDLLPTEQQRVIEAVSLPRNIQRPLPAPPVLSQPPGVPPSEQSPVGITPSEPPPTEAAVLEPAPSGPPIPQLPTPVAAQAGQVVPLHPDIAKASSPEQLAAFSVPDGWVVPTGVPLQTGTPATLQAYQGTGRTGRGLIYTEPESSGILGPASYYAATEGQAQGYGPIIASQQVTLQNPLVLTNDAQLYDVPGVPRYVRDDLNAQQQAGQALRSYAIEQGHDGVIVNIPSAAIADMTTDGQDVRTLRSMFDHSQAILLQPPTPAQPSVAPPQIQPSPLQGGRGAVLPNVPPEGTMPMAPPVFQSGDRVQWLSPGREGHVMTGTVDMFPALGEPVSVLVDAVDIAGGRPIQQSVRIPAERLTRITAGQPEPQTSVSVLETPASPQAAPLVPPGAQLPLLRPTWENAETLLQQVHEAQQSVIATDAAPIPEADEVLLEHLQQLQDLVDRYLRELPTPRPGDERQRLTELQRAQGMLKGFVQRLAGLQELPTDAPIVRLAKRLALRMGYGDVPRTLPQLQQLANAVYGGTRAQGAYSTDDLYDAVELAMNLYVLNEHAAIFDATGDIQQAILAIEVLDDLRAALPTKTVRTEETNKLQQFSTPHAYAFAVNWLANLQPGDRVLEPSAGTGDLATFAARVVGMDHVQVNEIAPRRVEILTALGFPNPTQADALFLHSILTPRGLPRPSVVVMNPPFSSMAQQGGYNTQVGARHAEEALKHLADGGRLVAIVGRGMTPDAATFRDFWQRILAQYTVRANVGVAGKVYAKMGTSFGTRLLIIDKGAATTPGTVRTGEVETIEELVRLLKDVRYDRTFTTQPAPGEPGSPQVAQPDSAVDRPPTAVSPPAHGVGVRAPAPGPGQEVAPPAGARPAGPEGALEPGGRTSVPAAAPPAEGGRPQPARTTGGRRPRRPGPAGTAGSQSSQEPAGSGLNQPTPPEREAPGTSVTPTATVPGKIDVSLSADALDALLDDVFAVPEIVTPLAAPVETSAPASQRPISRPQRSAQERSTQQWLQQQPSQPTTPSVSAQPPTALSQTPPVAPPTAQEALDAAVRDIFGDTAVEEEMTPYGAWVEGVDPAKYGRLHPLLDAAFLEAEQQGATLRDFLAKQAARYGPQVRPYLKQYILARRAQQTTETSLAEEPADSQFRPYVVQQLKVPNAKPHPEPIVETVAMASVMPPPVTYTPQIDPRVVASGAISLPQLEGITYAGQAHQRMLPTTPEVAAKRQGMLIGDAAGFGKNRQLVGIIADNFARGRTKAVWITQNDSLLPKVQRDWELLFPGGKADDVFMQKGYAPIKKDTGILYVTYATLRSQQSPQRTRIHQIVEWLGKDFDGVIIADESHNLQNAIPQNGLRGTEAASKQAQAWLDLDEALPAARIVYASATAATEVRNLAYASRLGIWGPHRAFADVQDFITKISATGVSDMELVARDLKALGLYLSRSISNAGIEYEQVIHALTPEQVDGYNTIARAWQIVIENINAALEDTASPTGKRNTAAWSIFWGAEQRFFNQLLTALQMPTLLARMRADVTRGDAVLLQFMNTNEAIQRRQLLRRPEGDEDYEDVQLNALDILMTYIEKSFPIYQIEDVFDNQGKAVGTKIAEQPQVDTEGRPVLNTDGEPVMVPIVNQEALQKRNALLADLAALNRVVPEPPLEQVLNATWTDEAGRTIEGADIVAEVTGRTQRLVYRKDENGVRRRVLETRNPARRRQETEEFRNDDRHILAYSEAGGTGDDYHADITRTNQRMRRHYAVQHNWRADQEIQGLGRSHRAGQRQPPWYGIAGTDVPAHKRFVSTIARRLDQLGALTRGQRGTATVGLFAEGDNLESRHAVQALKSMIYDLGGREVFGPLTRDDFEKQTQLQLETREGNVIVPDMTQFLNRLFVLTLDNQQRVWEAFSRYYDQVLEVARQEGTLHDGVERLDADHVFVTDTQTIATDPETGAETKYVQLRVQRRRVPRTWQDLQNILGVFNETHKQATLGIVRNVQSGRLYGIVAANPHTDEKGQVVEMARRIGTDMESMELLPRMALTRERYEMLDKQDPGTLAAWEAEVSSLPEFRETTQHLLTGVLVLHWDKLPSEAHPRVFHVTADTGERYLGRVVRPQQIQRVLQAFGRDATGAEKAQAMWTPNEAMTQIIDHKARIRLGNGWELKPSLVGGEWRIELLNWNNAARQELMADGMLYEIHNFNGRFFVPSGPQGTEVLSRLTQSRPIVEQVGGDSTVQEDETPYTVEEEAQPYGEPFAPIFYSRARQVIAERMPVRASADMILGILSPARSGVKQEELRWSGVAAWLREQEGPVTKQQVLDWLDAHQAQVEPVVLGEPVPIQWRAFPADVRRGVGAMWMTGSSDRPNSYIIERLQNGMYALRSPSGTRDVFDSLEEAKQRGEEYIVNSRSNVTATHFGVHTLPGAIPGTYREVLFTLPIEQQSLDSIAREQYGMPYEELDRLGQAFVHDLLAMKGVNYSGGPQPYTSPHWPGVQNPIAHLRLNDRVDTQGRRLLFLEEVQSDYNREGRARGFQDPTTTARLQDAADAARESFFAYLLAHGQEAHMTLLAGKRAASEGRLDAEAQSLLAVWEDADDALRRGWQGTSAQAVPPAPFVTTGDWYQLPLKWALRYAAERGYDGIALTTGAQQQERYNLRKVADEFVFVRHPTPRAGDNIGSLYAYQDGREVAAQDIDSEQHLADMIGRDNATKLLAQTVNPPSRDYGGPTQRLAGEQFAYGGEWAVNLYDKTIPQWLNKYAKTWGSRVESTRIDTLPKSSTGALEYGDALDRQENPLFRTEEVHLLPITPAMREGVVTKGQQLFEPGEPYAQRPDATPTATRNAHAALRAARIASERAVSVSAAGGESLVGQTTPGGMRGLRTPAEGTAIGRAIPEPDIIRQLRTTGETAFLHKDFSNHANIAAASTLIRDSRMERLFWAFTANRKVVETMVISSRMAGNSKAFPGFETPETIPTIQQHVRALQAIYPGQTIEVVLVHNHPTGDPTPSKADIATTRRLAKYLPITGHLVIDSGKYAFMKADDDFLPVIHELQGFSSDDPMLTPAIPHPLLGQSLNNPQQIRSLGLILDLPHASFPVFYRSQKGLARGIEIYAISDVLQAAKSPKELDTLVTYMKRKLRSYGSVSAAIYLDATDMRQYGLYDIALHLLRHGVVEDVVTQRWSLREQHPESFGAFRRPQPGYVVRESQQKAS